MGLNLNLRCKLGGGPKFYHEEVVAAVPPDGQPHKDLAGGWQGIIPFQVSPNLA